MAAVKGVLGKVSGVLLDLSGTLFVENAPTPGALAALDKSVPIYIYATIVTNSIIIQGCELLIFHYDSSLIPVKSQDDFCFLEFMT